MNKKIIGDYTNAQEEHLILWEFWEDDQRHVFNLLSVGDKPNLKSGGYYSLSALNCAKNGSLNIYNNGDKK